MSPKSLPLGGEGVARRVTDEGIAFPGDVGLGEAKSIPRIKEKHYSLC